MSNTTGGNKLQSTPWATERKIRLNAAIPATSTIYYAGQAAGRDAAGNMVQMDDTAPAEFLGILEELVRTQVDPIDVLGDKTFVVSQPQLFVALIAAAAPGDEGRKVYWKFNNEVSYSPGASGNLAGQVWLVKDSTHVEVLPPWMLADLLGAKALQTLPALAIVTLTKFDTGKTWIAPAGTPQQVILPAAAKCGSGDAIAFVNAGALNNLVTIKAAGADTINGAATFAMATAQYSKVTMQADGVSAWYVTG